MSIQTELLPDFDLGNPVATSLELRREKQNRRKLRRLEWMHFANDGYQASLQWFVPVVAMSGGLSAVKWGVLAAVHLSLGVLLGIPAGLLARRWGGNRLLALAMGVYGSSLLILATGTGELQVWLAMLLAGLGFGVFHPVGFSLVAQWAIPTNGAAGNAASAMGRFAAVGDVGRVLISWLIAGIIWCLGFQLGMAIAGSIAVLLSFRCLQLSANELRAVAAPVKTSPDAAKSTPRPWSDWRLILTNRSFRIATAIGACDSLATTGLLLFAPILLAAKGYSSMHLSIFVGLLYSGSLFGKVGMGIVADRWGHRASLIACQLGLVLVTAGLASFDNFWLDAMLVGALGLLTKGCLPIALALTAGSLPKEQCEVGFGVNQTVIGLASALSPSLLGLATSQLGPNLATVLMTGFSLLSILVLTRFACQPARR